MKYFKIYIVYLILLSCNNNQQYDSLIVDSNYVGMNKCAACHQEQYQNFINTGMGRSIRPAFKEYSSSDFTKQLHDTLLDFFYHPQWVEDSLHFIEYQLSSSGDTIHYLNYPIDYIVGSGHHTNSHLFTNNGYLYQAPVTYYTQDSILDFPPGFENNKNSRFSRKMGLECIACHNAYPDFVLGSENKYKSMPTGIDCERCHGPGELHLEKIKKGNITDTTKLIDYSIVNPADLSLELQNDLCARCHLQGNAVLKPHKSFFDFLPGMRLSDIMDVYLPRYSNSENDFIMASHVDRMKLSSCYIQSEENLSCVSCHNPHVSVHDVPENFFNSKCLDCHINDDCNEEIENKIHSNNDCVSCHMPASYTTDIPHVQITDHKIRIPNNDAAENIDTLHKEFLGLECVNNKLPDNLSIIQGYLQQYERFNPYSFYLDSAASYLQGIKLDNDQGIYVHIYYLFLRQAYNSIIKEVNNIGASLLLNKFLINKDYSNKDAWTCYRIGESYVHENDLENAFLFYQQAVKLAPYNLEFRNKYAISLFKRNKIEFAIDEFNFIINEDNNFVLAYANLGFLYFSIGKYSDALDYYNLTLKLDPYHEKTLINKAQLLLFENKQKDAFLCLEKILEIYPNNKDALTLLNQINEI